MNRAGEQLPSNHHDPQLNLLGNVGLKDPWRRHEALRFYQILAVHPVGKELSGEP
jgi:hypothetical protein